MSALRSLAVVVLAILLTLTMVTANVVAVTHMTVLDPNFVDNSIEEEGGYALLANATQDAILSNATGNLSRGPIDGERIVENVVTEEYIASQAEANIDNTYAYLHGASGTLNVSLDTEPVKENITLAVERSIRNASLAELVNSTDVELREPVNATVLRRLSANRTSYRDAKAEFREEARERAIDSIVNETFQQASNDQLLALVVPNYDPTAYTQAEKDRMVRDRETEIKAALRQRVKRQRGDAIERRIDERLADARTNVTSQTGETPTEQAVIDVQSAVARGLTTDMTYQQYQQTLSEAKGNLSAAIGNRTEARLDEQVPDRIYVIGGPSVGAPPPLQTARTVVQVFDVLTLLLPIGVLVLLGLVYLASKNVGTVVATLGASLLVAGLPLFLAKSLVAGIVTRALSPGPGVDPLRASFQELAVGIVQQTLGVAGQVTVTSAVAGLVLLAIGAAARLGAFDPLVERIEAARGGEAAAPAEGGAGDGSEGDPLDDPTDGAGAAGGVDADTGEDAGPED